jgi:hypothetical protein
MKKQDKSIKLDDALAKAKNIVKAQQTIQYGGGSKLRYKLLHATLGKRAANYITKDLADKDAIKEAHGHLRDYEKFQEGTGHGIDSGAPTGLLKTIMGKLDRIEKAVLAIKMPRMAEAQVLSKPPMAEKTDANTEVEKDVELALKNLYPDFHKGDIKELLARVRHLDTAKEKVSAILKANGKAEKIPRPAVAAAVAHLEPQAVTPGEKAAPLAPQAVTPGENAAPLAPQPSAAPASKLMANDAKDDEDQQEAEKVKELEAQERERKAQEAREEKIQKELDDIKKLIGHTGLADLITQALVALGGALMGVIGKGLWKLVKGAGKLLLKGAKLAWDGLKWVGKSIKDLLMGPAKTLEKEGAKEAAEVGEKSLVKEGEKIGAEEAAKVGSKSLGKFFLKKIPVIGALAGLGFAAMDLMDGDVKGAALDAASGIVSTIPGLGTAASVAIDAAHAGLDIAGVTGAPQPPKSNDAAARLAASADETDTKDDDDKPPVVVKQDNRKTTIVQGGGGGETSPVIKVRNDEPTAAGLTAGLFDHPAGYAMVYRM